MSRSSSLNDLNLSRLCYWVSSDIFCSSLNPTTSSELGLASAIDFMLLVFLSLSLWAGISSLTPVLYTLFCFALHFIYVRLPYCHSLFPPPVSWCSPVLYTFPWLPLARYSLLYVEFYVILDYPYVTLFSLRSITRVSMFWCLSYTCSFY